MGSYYRFKHYRGEGIGGGYGGVSGSQKEITRFMPRFNKNDSSLMLPVLKEVGKVIFPPAAIPIEILYQLYTHADAISDLSSAIVNGNYEEALKVVVTQVVKDASNTAVSVVTSQPVGQVAASAGEAAGNSIKDEKSKELTKKVVEASVKGGTEGIQEKIVDYTVDKLKESIRDNGGKNGQ